MKPSIYSLTRQTMQEWGIRTGRKENSEQIKSGNGSTVNVSSHLKK